MTASMHIEGDDKLLRSIKGMGDHSARRALMDEIGSYGVASTQERFLQQQGPDGRAWEKSGRARKAGGQTLVDSARLFQSITHEASANHAAWGSNIIYAGIHQFGGEIKAKGGGKLKFRINGGFVSVDKVDMPARPYFGINAEDRVEINSIIQDWIGRQMQ